MANKKTKKAPKAKVPSCKVLKDANGITKKTAAGKIRKICHKDGKIVSEATVKAYRKRKAAGRKAA